MITLLDQHKDVVALVILGATFAAFLLERFPPAVVAICGAATFLLAGYITTKDVLAVFSNSAPITIAALFILSGALVRTGALEAAASWVASRATNRPRSTIAAFFAGATGASAFVNNTPVVAVLIPVVYRLAQALRIAPTQLLIPLSYAAIVGGTCTLIGTSTNLLVDGVARASGMAAFSIFEITPIGLVAAVTGLVTTLVLAPRLLPARISAKQLTDAEGQVEFLSELTICEAASVEAKALGSVRLLNRPGIRILSVERDGRAIATPLAEHVLAAGDRITILATMPEILTLHAEQDFRVAGSDTARAGDRKIVVEAVLAPSAGGPPWQRLDELRLDRFGVRLLGLSRHRATPGTNLRSARLRAADRLLLEGTPEGLAAAAEETNLFNLTQPRARSFRRRKAPIAIGAMVAVVVLAAANVMPIEGLACIAIAAILLLRCIDAEEAWQSVDANILVLIFAMLAIGTGLEKTGAVNLIVRNLEPMLGQGSPLLVLFAMYFLAVALTELITNNAVAIVLTPIAIGVAENLGVDARPLVVAVMFGASACFATPIGYQTNTMVYGAGEYRFADFLKIGIPMNLIVGIATCTAIYVFMPLGQ